MRVAAWQGRCSETTHYESCYGSFSDRHAPLNAGKHCCDPACVPQYCPASSLQTSSCPRAILPLYTSMVCFPLPGGLVSLHRGKKVRLQWHAGPPCTCWDRCQERGSGSGTLPQNCAAIGLFARWDRLYKPLLTCLRPSVARRTSTQRTAVAPCPCLLAPPMEGAPRCRELARLLGALLRPGECRCACQGRWCSRQPGGARIALLPARSKLTLWFVK